MFFLSKKWPCLWLPCVWVPAFPCPLWGGAAGRCEQALGRGCDGSTWGVGTEEPALSLPLPSVLGFIKPSAPLLCYSCSPCRGQDPCSCCWWEPCWRSHHPQGGTAVPVTTAWSGWEKLPEEEGASAFNSLTAGKQGRGASAPPFSRVGRFSLPSLWAEFPGSCCNLVVV